MALVNTNLSNAQIEGIETILTWLDNHIGNACTAPVDGRVWKALVKANYLVYTHDTGIVQLTPECIQAFCATILTKYTGATHERIHSALNNYQRLFNR